MEKTIATEAISLNCCGQSDSRFVPVTAKTIDRSMGAFLHMVSMIVAGSMADNVPSDDCLKTELI